MTVTYDLLALFQRCLYATYEHTDEGGDYAIQVDSDTYTVYLLFEWSNGAEDWKNNLCFMASRVNPKASPEWYCHRGFLKVWNAMRDEVTERILYRIHKLGIKHVICVGYSHGAALALLATEALVGLIPTDVSISGYGFGCPRVVFGYLPSEVKARLNAFYPIRNINDLITHLPPAIFGFRHHKIIEIGEKGKYTPIKAHTPQAYLCELKPRQTPISRYTYGTERHLSSVANR